MSSGGLALGPIRTENSSLPAVRFGGGWSPDRPMESVLIYLAIPGSSVVPMRVLESDSIASVKLRIQSFKGFVVKNQKLVFDGREMARNDCLVRDYGVTEGNVLHLVIRLSDLRVITVKTSCGKKFKFQVERGQNIRYIKQQIAAKSEDLGDLEDHTLIFDGEELEDHRQITEICKNNSAVIHLLIRKSAKVRTRPIKNDLEAAVISPDAKQTRVVHRNALVELVVGNPNIRLSPLVMNMVRQTFSGLEKGNFPVMSTEGTGGAYFMPDASGYDFVAVFKPADEEPMAKNNPHGLPLSTDGEGLKRGTRVGEGALREVAAYILDHPVGGRRLSDEPGFAGVPPTVLARCLCGCFGRDDGFGCADGFKVGSLQMFMKNCGSCEDMGPRAFPVEEVHKIAVLDIRLANADRHAGNILVCKKGEEGHFMLVPIDHGYCLPESLEDCTFEWLYWPQAHQPFSAEALNYIKSLNAEDDIELLKFHGWEPSPESARVLRIGTMLLKKGAERGLTPYAIGSMMCRETLKKESKIEQIIHETEGAVLPGSTETVFMETLAEIVDRHLDELVR